MTKANKEAEPAPQLIVVSTQPTPSLPQVFVEPLISAKQNAVEAIKSVIPANSLPITPVLEAKPQTTR
jgi:hypothetical protein